MKQAFLIIAHGQFMLLKTLIDLLSTDERSYIYVHVDSKTTVPQWLATQFRGGKNIKQISRRLDVRWGDRSQVDVEALLFEEAYRDGPYENYHLLSGVDLPIKPVSEILDFFEANKGKEFVGFVKDVPTYRITRYYSCTRHLKNKGFIRKAFWRATRTILNACINPFYHKNIDGITLAKGCNWLSITHDFCGYLLQQKELVERLFAHTMAPDEFYVHTILMNSPFKGNIYNLDDEYEGCMREIDWHRGNPYTWGQNAEDFDILKNSDKMFARKFDECISAELIQRIMGLATK